MSFYEGFEKRSVDLKGLRKAWDATVKPHMMRRIHRKAQGPAYLRGLDNVKSFSALKRLAGERGREDKDFLSGFEKSLKRKGHGLIGIKGSSTGLLSKMEGNYMKEKKRAMGRLFSKTKREDKEAYKKSLGRLKGFRKAEARLTPKSKEAVNRLVGVHEGIERHLAKKKKLPGGTFASHISPEVLLRESNIVSTLPKDLKGAKNFFKTMRGYSGETEKLKEMFPGFEYGKGRISRHARKRMMERAVEKGRTKPGVTHMIDSAFASGVDKGRAVTNKLKKGYNRWKKFESDIAGR